MSATTTTTPTTTPPAPTPSEPIWAKPSIGVYALLLFLAALGVSWWAKNDTAFNLLTGAVISNASAVINYYFGSSSGSQKKDEVIAAGKQQAP